MWKNPQETADLVTFTEENLNFKNFKITQPISGQYSLSVADVFWFYPGV